MRSDSLIMGLLNVNVAVVFVWSKKEFSCNSEILKIVTGFPFLNKFYIIYCTETAEKPVTTQKSEAGRWQYAVVLSIFNYFLSFARSFLATPANSRLRGKYEEGGYVAKNTWNAIKSTHHRFHAFHGKITGFLQDFTEDENPEEKGKRHKEQEVSAFMSDVLDQ